MNGLVLCGLLLAVAGAMAQYRPFYAGNGVQYPKPFGSSSGDDGLSNRFGSEAPALASRFDENGHDIALVQEAAKLPREQQPFWYLNREQIRKHLGVNQPQPQAQVQARAQPAVLRFRPTQALL